MRRLAPEWQRPGISEVPLVLRPVRWTPKLGSFCSTGSPGGCASSKDIDSSICFGISGVGKHQELGIQAGGLPISVVKVSDSLVWIVFVFFNVPMARIDAMLAK